MKTVIFLLVSFFACNSFALYHGIPTEVNVKKSKTVNLTKFLLENSSDFANGKYHLTTFELIFCSKQTPTLSLRMYDLDGNKIKSIRVSEVEELSYKTDCYNYLFNVEEINAQYEWKLKIKGKGQLTRLMFDLDWNDLWEEEQDLATPGTPGYGSGNGSGSYGPGSPDSVPGDFDGNGRNRCNPDSVCDEFDNGGSGGGYDTFDPITGGGYFGV